MTSTAVKMEETPATGKRRRRRESRVAYMQDSILEMLRGLGNIMKKYALLQEQGHYDPATGLLSPERLRIDLAELPEDDNAMLAFIRCEHLDALNEIFGNIEGNRIRGDFTHRMRNQFRTGFAEEVPDGLYRLADDSEAFILLLHFAADKDDAIEKRILDFKSDLRKNPIARKTVDGQSVIVVPDFSYRMVAFDRTDIDGSLSAAALPTANTSARGVIIEVDQTRWTPATRGKIRLARPTVSS